MTRLFYIVQSEMLTGGVIESNVIANLRAQSAIAGQPRTTLLFLEPARVAFSARARETLKLYRALWPGGDIRIVPFVGRLGESAPAISLRAYVACSLLSGGDAIFHCRGPEATWTAHQTRSFIGRGTVVFDMRDHYPLQTIHRLGSPRIATLTAATRRAYDAAHAADARAARVADRVFVVSPRLKTYATEVLGKNPECVDVVPSCVNDVAFDADARRSLRRQWSIADTAPVVAYAGRIGPERLPQLMFRLFRAVLTRRPDARLMLFLYRNDLPDLPATLAAAGIPEHAVIVRRETRDAVTAQLCAADVGLLFCEPADRYDYWFPIKFPEYLSAGLGVVLTSQVGSLPSLVQRRDIGWVMEHDANDRDVDATAATIVAGLETDGPGLRSRACAACADLYLWRNHVPAIREAYGLQVVDDRSRRESAATPSSLVS